MRRRRLRKEGAQLEITAFINLIVVLVPFLLSTAVFTRLAVMDLTLPAPGLDPALQKLDGAALQLEVVLRPEALEVGDRVGGLIQRIEARGGLPDVKTLAAVLVQIKARFPEQREVALLAEPQTPYEQIVQVMDAARSTYTTAPGAKVVRAELFPLISIGDAPPREVKAAL